ncbi:Yip1 family protein [Draconibacterium sp. IB214405]|uniref:Yip1 family protein n=1 Tax=Draconibacterium sp. IB214405 TaxID=3097352 RepID=UPI002A170BF5|nr:Yip1 family protein [Draconibacterium sp. IB214405]MDX8341025.1 Yip1 family protein [Draconibacterium sp. IB214405]
MEFSFSKHINEIKLLIVKPAEFWEEQKETENSDKLWLSYLLPIVLAVALSVFIGEFFRRTDFFIQYPLVKAFGKVVLFVLQYFVSVFFTTALMKTFGAEKKIDVARKLVVYSMTPMLLVALVTNLFQFLYILDILGMYSFYLFWVGAKKLLTFPNNKEQSYILITIVVNFFVFSFLNVFLSELLKAFY